MKARNAGSHRSMRCRYKRTRSTGEISLRSIRRACCATLANASSFSFMESSRASFAHQRGRCDNRADHLSYWSAAMPPGIGSRIALITALVLLVVPPATYAQAWKPDKVVELVVYAAPGGGADKTVRILQKIVQDNKWIDSSAVVNKVGGGGSVAFTYLSQQSGGHHVGLAQ